MTTRRDFLARGLRDSTLIALAPTLPGFLARTATPPVPEKDGRILVVVQLDGGNDGINTVVPFKDDGYAKYRKAIRLPEKRLIKINGEIGLHPAMGDAGKLLESGRLAIVPGVGLSQPEPLALPQQRDLAIGPARRAGSHRLGWIGRGLDGGPSTRDGAPAAMLIGPDSPPPAIRGRRSVSAALDRLDDYALTDKEAESRPNRLRQRRGRPGPASSAAACWTPTRRRTASRPSPGPATMHALIPSRSWPAGWGSRRG